MVRVGQEVASPPGPHYFEQAGDRRHARLLPAVCSAKIRSLDVMNRTVSALGVVSTKPAPSVAGAVWHPVREKLKAQSPVIKIADFSIVFCPLLEKFGCALGNLAFNGRPFGHSALVVAYQVCRGREYQPTSESRCDKLGIAPPRYEKLHHITAFAACAALALR
jgi:hypothetical protein